MKAITSLAVGDTLEQENWTCVDQNSIDKFAAATGDYQWIHMDVKRCQSESPFKTTIAHGFLTASLMPKAFNDVVEPSESVAQVINYGVDSLRFLQPVPSGASVKFAFEVVGIEDKSLGKLLKVKSLCNIKGIDDPAMVGTFLMLIMFNQ